jgi:hypothetical protein
VPGLDFSCSRYPAISLQKCGGHRDVADGQGVLDRFEVHLLGSLDAAASGIPIVSGIPHCDLICPAGLRSGLGWAAQDCADPTAGRAADFVASRAETACAVAAVETVLGVRRGKAALSSGCKPHPATAPAGSNRSSHGGNEVAEALGWRATKYGGSATALVNPLKPTLHLDLGEVLVPRIDGFNFDPLMATLATLSRPSLRHSATNSRQTARISSPLSLRNPRSS